MFHDSLKALIEDRGIKQAFIANKLGIAHSTFSMIVNGKTSVDVERFVDICNAVNMSPTELYYYSDKRTAAAFGLDAPPRNLQSAN